MAAHLRSWSSDLLTRICPAVNPLVVDVGSGDGALLEHFVAAGLDVLGFESRADLAGVANAAGIHTISAPFGMAEATDLAAGGRLAGLVLVNHVFAHVEDLGALAAAVRVILTPDGWLAVEFHDLASLVEDGQFDAISHAHRAYLSLSTLRALLGRHGLNVVATRRSAVYGGSIQVLARSRGAGPVDQIEIDRLLVRDRVARLDDPATFARLGERARDCSARLRKHLEDAAERMTRVAGYGAPGRAVTLLGVAGVDSRLLPYTVDRDPSKQGRCLPGSGIPIRALAALEEDRPDEIVVLAWTWADEIRADLIRAGTWAGRLVVPLPDLRVDAVG
jgi:SAM-dependent methyltransferase